MIGEGGEWLEAEFGLNKDTPNVPFDKDDQRRIIRLLRDDDSEAALKKARKDFEELYGYKPSV